MESVDDGERERQRALVRAGYNAISHAYRADRGTPNPESSESMGNYGVWVEELGGLLQPGARVLDLGCGAGVPTSKLLADAGFAVTGVDIAEVQIERARSLVPNATFIQADLARWDAAPASFDAVVCLYTLIHVPLQDQRELVPRLHEWLVTGGYLLVIVGHERWTGVEEYMGAPMFWDHADEATYLSWLEAARLRVLWHRYIPEGSSGHTLVLAQAA
jgi:2-polyprenyl-3-methyl-5-hydroxy-6-metoxy-1,4-benzoquinol methylase